ncbi:hypothetical protein JHK82_017715 [Glycine max]|nr:hypothetical protein JHK82_017715 [Glycine max]
MCFQVEIPNLENLNLISMNKIQNIWSHQPPSNFCFQNLIKLVVKDCHNLRYLCSLSVASSLRKLKGLFVSNCKMMEKIFSTEGNSADKGCVFPKLEEIHLDQMDKLTDIWQAEVSADSFSSLTSVYIYRCNKLDKIFPSHMEGWFASLNSLKVYSCQSVKVIFEIKDSQQADASGGIDTNLQVVEVWILPKLKQVWSRDPGGILNFKKLQSIQVFSCDRLRNVFPASVGKDVPKLEYMSVSECHGIVEIVACEDGSETNTEQLVFPELTDMKLCYLSSIQHFYRGRHPIECPKLKKLEVRECNKKLKTFGTGERSNEEDEAVMSAEKIFPNLEFLDIHFGEAQKWLLSNTVKHPMHRLKELWLSEVNDGERLCQILYRMPNLEKLLLWEAKHLLKESSESRLGTVLQLKELVLWRLETKDIGFEREPVLQRLELLSLYECHKLRNLGPPSVSLAYLTNLKVEDCKGLRNLMASSTAKSLVQLKSMKISECNELEEIVSNEGNEEAEQIVFGRLITIELEGLKKLKSFCSYKKCEFKFPSLEVLIVRDCRMMQTFAEGGASAPKLQNIVTANEEGKEEAKWQWEGDLNATIQKGLQNIWQWKGDFNATKQKVTSKKEGKEENIVSANEEGKEEAKWQWEGDLNATIQNVWEDQLWDSADWRSNIDLKDSPLQEIWLRLHSLHIPPHFRFTYLDTLIVDGCHFLSDAVLPFSLLPLLPKLKTLKVRNCDFVKIIFDVTTMGPLPFALEDLILERLPNLENVWNSNVELTFPQVKSLALCDLPKLKYDMLKPFTHLESHALNQVCIQKLTPNIEHLTLGQHELNMILSGEFQGNHLNELKVLALFFHFESDVFLQRVPNIEKLEVCDGSFKETFCFDSHNVDEDGLLSQLKVICPDSLPELVSIGSENSGIVPFLRNLETLQVISCFSSINLVPCTVSFSNLTYLQVYRCKSLLYLFTSSTARSLGQLKTMKISNCDSIEEIVSSTEEGDESDENEIIFQQLNCLKLDGLRKLRRFYKGSLSFPSLEEFTVFLCERMESLCAGTVKTDKLLLVNINWKDIPLETDLNSAMQNR